MKKKIWCAVLLMGILSIFMTACADKPEPSPKNKMSENGSPTSVDNAEKQKPAGDTDVFLRTKGIWRFGGELDTAIICMDGLGSFQAYYANGIMEEEGYLEYVDEYGDGNGRYDMYDTDGEFFAGFYFDSDTTFHIGNEDGTIYLLDISSIQKDHG